jgi:hypothetical protein
MEIPDLVGNFVLVTRIPPVELAYNIGDFTLPSGQLGF